jgi:oligopeptide transport system substrate-binding protein
VGNGPFVLERWDVNRKIRMRKSPTYWAKDVVRLETVDALPIEGGATALNLYLTGEVDWAPSGYPLDLVDRVSQRDDFQSNAGNGVYYYRFNCTRKPFDDPRVRKAFSLAFDRDELVREVTRLGQVPATGYVPPGIPGYESAPSDLRFDPEQARRLLAEAGFPGGRGFPRAAILYNTYEAHKKIAEYIAASWKRVLGVEVIAENEEWQSYQESTRRLDYWIARAAWIADYRDPMTFLDMWVTNGGNNQTGWGDAFYDRLIALAGDPFGFAALPKDQRDATLSRFRFRARAEEHLQALLDAEDAKERLRAAEAFRFDLFREAEAILFQDQFPICPIYYYVYTALVSDRVEGYYAKVLDDSGRWIDNLQDQHPFREVWVRPAAAEAR